MVQNIFIVRHGESVHQVSSDVWQRYDNAGMPLTPLGIRQAIECGEFLAQANLDESKTLIISSPFERSMQTAAKIQELLPKAPIKKDPLLVEQDFGLFTGLSTPQCYETYPIQARLYDLHSITDGAYFVTPPRGESKADVMQRVKTFMKDIEPLLQDENKENLIIVSHCVIGRALSTILNRQSPEWFLAQKPFENCSVKHFAFDGHKWQDRGLIFAPKEKSAHITIADISNSKKGNEL